MVAEAPKTVRLRFNEPVTPAVIRVIDAEGNTRNDAVVRAANETIEITLPLRLPAGTQVITLRNKDLKIERKVTVQVPTSGSIDVKADLLKRP